MKCPTGWLLAIAILICSPVSARAQQPAPADKTEKPAPVPLFPKHRRGFYKNNDDIKVVDATPQSPPLETDDPSVPDKGEYEINLSTTADFSSDERTFNVLHADANYGIVLKGFGHELPTQVKFEFPLVAQRDGDNPYATGLGDAAFGLKFNFYNDEHRGLRISIYPQIKFGTEQSVDKGLADPGQTVIVPVLFSREAKYVTIAINAGLEKPIHDAERQTAAAFGFGVGRAMTRKVALMADVRYESALDFKEDRLASLNIGVIHGVRDAIVYARVGHTVFSDDGPHFMLGCGVKVMLHQLD